MADPEEDGRWVEVRLEAPEGFRTLYATNLVVQHTKHEFMLTFFEVIPPPLMGSPEMKKQQLENIKEVRASCLARVAIASSRMEEFIQVLTDNFKTFKATSTPATERG